MADQNTGGALLEFPIRTINNFKIDFSIVAVAQWAKHWSSVHRVMQAEGSSPGGDIYQFFSVKIFISVL